MSNKNPRRKGNAQTASSSRAAELLQSSGVLLPSLLGLEASNEGGQDSSFIDIDEFGSSINPEFRIALKKLTKRDSYTREKAVKELDDLLNNSSYDQIKESYPAFASAYSKLDSSPVIRGAANAIVMRYVSLLKKDASGQLKLIMPLLLISISDGYGQVARSAENVLKECFADEKRQLIMKNFAQQAIEIALSFINKTHRLVQPQKFVEEESDIQRQNRLISQALTSIQKLIDEPSQLREDLYEQFSKPALLTALMNMGVNVKTAVFLLLKKLLERNSEPFLTTRIPSIVLSHLDSAEIAICRNSFECFLILATQEKFYESCKLDKAVVPKFISLMRKKSIHWKVLETSLLPSIALIFKHLPESSQEKWLTSIMDSFFEGNLSEAPISSWVRAFVEVSKFCFLNSKGGESFISFLLSKLHKFVEISASIKDEATIKQAVSLLVWIYVRNGQSETRFLPNFMFESFKKEFSANLINKLPDSEVFIKEFIDQCPDSQLIFYILSSNSTTNSLFIEALDTLQPEETSTFVKTTNLAESFKQRINKESNSKTVSNLLKSLCRLIDQGLIQERLESIINVESLDICSSLISNCPSSSKLLGNSTRESIVKHLGKAVLEEAVREDLWTPLCSWLVGLEEKSIEDLIVNLFEDSTDALNLLVTMINSLMNANKISNRLEKFLSSTILRNLIHECLEGEHDERLLYKALEISSRLNANVDEIIDISRSFVKQCRSADEIEKLADLMSKLKFTNFDIHNLVPNNEELIETANSIDSKFASFLLSEFQLLACYAPENTQQSTRDHQTLEFLARNALFLRYVNREEPQGVLYTESIGCITNLVLQEAFICKTYGIPLDIVEKLNETRRPNSMIFDAFVEVFSYFSEPAPLSIISLLWSCLIKSEHVEARPLIQFASKVPENVAQISSLLFSTGINRSFPPFEEKSLTQLTEELENASYRFSAENRAEIFVLLSDFVEKDKARCEEWLFMIQKTGNSKLDAHRNSLSCAILRLCSQAVVYLLEVGDTLRDFINCGFLTSLQSCTEFLENRERSDFVDLSVYLCMQLYKTYSRSVQLNQKDVDFADIVQEWQEFVGLSTTSYILRWFTLIERRVELPEFCLKSLCSAIHSMDYSMIIRADLADSFTDPFVDSIEEWKKYPTDSSLSVLLRSAARLLLNKHPEVQFSAAHILKCATPTMFQIENEQAIADPQQNSDEETTFHEDKNKKLPALFQRILSIASEFDLIQFKLPSNELFSNALICPIFLIWDVLLQFLSELDALTRVDYCESLDPATVNNVMTYLFTKLPDPPVAKHGQSMDDLFRKKFDFMNPKDFISNDYLCNLYYRTLTTIPALVREWYNSMRSSDKLRGLSGIVYRYTKEHVSKLLLSREMMENRNNLQSSDGRLSIKCLSKINEIVAGYKLEESTMTLNISLPTDYPLSVPSINNEKCIVSKGIQRRWLLQLDRFLSHQNGSMMDGIEMWKRNVDKHLEGVEDCTICMMTVSITNKLPRIRCKQCKKKFHADCLFKWFETSSKNSCPLCRSKFF